MSIKIDLKIFLFAILFYLTKQIQIYAIIMLFALVHELGHLVCGLVLGFKPNSIKINPFGFQIHFKTCLQDYRKKVKNGNELCVKKIVIALAGPLVNLFIILICLVTKNSIQVENIIYANLILLVFNLIPIYPLDGGRILGQIVHIQKGKEKSYEVTNYIAKLTVVFLTIITSIVILYVHNIAFIIILAYLWYLVIKNEKDYKIKTKIYEQIRNKII